MTIEMIREIEVGRRAVNWAAMKLISALLAIIGAVAFLYVAVVGDAARAWQAYLTNFVFWTGLSTGAFLLSPILVITNARWGRPVKRIAEAAGAFIPISFLLFWGLFAGRVWIFPWISHPLHEKSKLIWLNVPFLFLRDGLALAVLALTFILITYHSVKADLEVIGGGKPAEGHFRSQAGLAPVYTIAYAFILSLLSFDLVMSLNPQWYSTLFGAYYFMGSFYSGLAALVLLSAFAVKVIGTGGFITKKQFHDLGKLLFAFCLVCADFFYVQFLVIWYGNMPEETRYVITRVVSDPWALLAWTVLFTLYVIPFLVLLIRKLKMVIWFISLMSIWILIAMWLERFLLVAPSISKAPSIPLGLTEAMVSLGYLGLFCFCTAWFLGRYPAVALSDPLLTGAAGHETGEHGLASGAAEA